MSSPEQAATIDNQRDDPSTSGTPEKTTDSVAAFGVWFATLSLEDKARIASITGSSSRETGPAGNATGQMATTASTSVHPFPAPLTSAGWGVPSLAAFSSPPPGLQVPAVSPNPLVKTEPLDYGPYEPYPTGNGREHSAEASTESNYARGPFANQHRTVGDIPKLHGRNNWFAWKTLFFFAIRTVNGAIEHLTSTIPRDRYSYSFDIHLGDLLVRTLAVDQLGPVMLLMNSGEMRGSKLYAGLRTPYERTDAATRGQIEDTLSALKQGSHSAAQLNQTLTHLFSQALNAGVQLDEERKIYFLCKSLHPKYGPFNGQLNVMARRGLVATYEVAIEDLYVEEGRLRQVEAESRKVDTSAQAFAAALYGGAPYEGQSSDREPRKQGSRGYTFKGNCHRCGKVGHKRNRCREPMAEDGPSTALIPTRK
ncbi:hypothetical protein CF319_g9147 [Tilletia indica]|nr:hypothetical protein CF319_g9147 [Tilletia indica]KAE8227624.1 hypothetical protein CF326_g7475 [Tilletia indica]